MIENNFCLKGFFSKVANAIRVHLIWFRELQHRAKKKRPLLFGFDPEQYFLGFSGKNAREKGKNKSGKGGRGFREKGSSGSGGPRSNVGKKGYVGGGGVLRGGGKNNIKKLFGMDGPATCVNCIRRKKHFVDFFPGFSSKKFECDGGCNHYHFYQRMRAITRELNHDGSMRSRLHPTCRDYGQQKRSDVSEQSILSEKEESYLREISRHLVGSICGSDELRCRLFRVLVTEIFSCCLLGPVRTVFVTSVHFERDMCF